MPQLAKRVPTPARPKRAKRSSPGEWVTTASTGRALMRAIIEVQAVTHEPGAEHWTTNEAKFNILRSQVIRHWAAATGTAAHLFPWRDDFIKRGWIKYRKDTYNGKPETREWAYGTEKPCLG